jgi:hypothetical protein
MAVAVVVADLILIAVAWYHGEHWLINTQVGFWSAAMIVAASMVSYTRMVQGRLVAGVGVEMEERDVIEKLDDPFDLYSEAVAVPPDPDKTTAIDADTIKATIQNEKARHKMQRRSIGQTLRDARPFLSLYRLGAYGLLLFGFAYLRANSLFEPLPYQLGIGTAVAAIVAILIHDLRRKR